MKLLSLLVLIAAACSADDPARVVSRTRLDDAHIVVVWSDGRTVTNRYTVIPGSLYTTTLPSGQTVTNAIWWTAEARTNASAKGTSKPEVWLTPERAAALKSVASRPYVVTQERLNADTVVYHWTNGLHGAVTTQHVEQVLGKRAKSAWQDKVDAKEKEKQALLDDLKAVKDKPTKAALEAIITKHGKK